MATPEVALQQARRLIRHRQYADAIVILKQLLAANDLSAVVHEALGSAYFLAGQNAEAAQHFERLTRLVPHPGRAYINLGAVYNRTGEYQKAVESIRKGLQYEKRSAEGYYNLGVAHRKLNQLDLAVTAYREAIRLDPQFAEPYQNYGNILLEQGRFEESIRQFNKALTIRPNFERARRGLTEAEQAMVTAKSGGNPFGRLVDPSRSQAGRESGPRLTTEADRHRDRTILHELAKEMHIAAGEWVALLQGQLEAALLQVEKQVVLGKSQDAAYSLGDFEAAYQATEDGRRRVRRKVLELVAHEELLHSPD